MLEFIGDTHYLALGGCIVCAASGQLLLKAGTNRNPSVVSSFLNPLALTGYAIFVLNTILAVYALQVIDLITASTWGAFVFVLVSVLSRVFLHERLTWGKIIGSLIIVAGIIVFFTGR